MTYKALSSIVVTSPGTSELMQLNVNGDELRQVQLPQYMNSCHAVMSMTGTFIISHYSKQLSQDQ